MSCFRAFTLVISITIFSALGTARADQLATHIRVPTEGSYSKRLDIVLNDLFHREALLTLAGLKPVAWVAVDDPHGLATLLDGGRREGLVRNSDLGWIAGKRYAEPADNFILYNRRALAETLQDQSAAALLSEAGLAWINSPELAIQWLAHVLEHHPHDRRSPIENVGIGIFLGFPISDVRQFVENGGHSGKAVRLYSDHEFYMGAMMAMSAESEQAIGRLQDDANAAVARYRDARQRGQSSLAILNDWRRVSKRLSARCERLLIY